MSNSSAVVYVVDDDSSVRKALELLIWSAGWESETFASGEEFLAFPKTVSPSCLILDLSLPDIHGLELQRRMAGDHGAMPIIFISGYGDVPVTVQAMKAGAVEFLTKPVGTESLLAALHHAIERSSAMRREADELGKVRNCYKTLSRRERQVMELVVAGLLNKQVASDLGISEITVKAHRGQVMRKMQADSLADLVKLSAQLGIATAQRSRRSAGTREISAAA